MCRTPPNRTALAVERTPDQILALLRDRGADRLRRVALRRNRSTLWSLTQGGRNLNLHRAYGRAPMTVLRAFVVIAGEGWSRRRSERYERACRTVAAWPGVGEDIRRIRAAERRRRRTRRQREPGVGPCCATPDQLRYLAQLYQHLNATRFDNRLPSSVPLRLSRRMRSRLGQMVPGSVGGRRVVVEIALNLDLMLEGNGRERVQTLLHEMAHAADYLWNGASGHGETWRDWARRVGCDPRACCHAPIRRRRNRSDAVVRVPPLREGWRELRDRSAA